MKTERQPALLSVATDESRAAALARATVALLAPRPVVVASVWHPVIDRRHDPVAAALDATFDLVPAIDQHEADQAEDAAEAASTVLRDAGWEVKTRVRRDTHQPWAALLEQAAELDAAVIVTGSTNRPDIPGNVSRQTRALAHRTHTPLLAIPPDFEVDPDAPLLLAADGSEASERAVVAAQVLLRRRPAIVATAWQPYLAVASMAMAGIPGGVTGGGVEKLDRSERDRASGIAHGSAEALRADGWSVKAEPVTAADGIWQDLVAAGREHHAAVLACGTRGRSRLAAVLLGSVAEEILRHAARPVLLVPPPA